MDNTTPDRPEKKGPSRRDVLGFAAAATVSTSLPPAIMVPMVPDHERQWLGDAARILGVRTLSEKQKALLTTVDTWPLIPETVSSAKHYIDMLGQSLPALEQLPPDQLHTSLASANKALNNVAWFVNLCSEHISDLSEQWQQPPAQALKECCAILKDPDAIRLLTNTRTRHPSHAHRKPLSRDSLDTIRGMLDRLSQNPDACKMEVAGYTNRLIPLIQKAVRTDPDAYANFVSRITEVARSNAYIDPLPPEWNELTKRVARYRPGEGSLPDNGSPDLLQPPTNAPGTIRCQIEKDTPKNALAERDGEKERHYTITAGPEQRLSAMQFRNQLATHVPEASVLGRMGKTKIETIVYTKEKDGQPELFQHALRISTNDDEVRQHLDKCCSTGTIDLPTLRQSIDCAPTPRGRG